MPRSQRTLLVPGTQATSLRDHNGNVVYNAVRVQLVIGRRDLGERDATAVGMLLGMEHKPGKLKPERTSLEDGTHVVKGDVLRTPYDGLPVTDWWRYDWRADLRHNAIKLLQTLEAEREPGVRWNLIGHSQGALVIILASKLAVSPRQFAEMVGRVVLVGGPIAGTVRALEAILFGREDLGEDNLPGILAAARTWPALYQMLPSWPCALDEDDQPLGADLQFCTPGGWPDLVDVDGGIPSDLLQRARETQALLTGPFSHLVPGVDTLVIMGKRQMTPISVPRRGGIFVAEYRNQKGDSLVPEKITQELIGTPIHDRRRIFEGKVKAHAMLCVDPQVQKLIGTFFEQPLPPLPAG
jgi:pimeloyl-ACP methyl ester carboxylesterase